MFKNVLPKAKPLQKLFSLFMVCCMVMAGCFTFCASAVPSWASGLNAVIYIKDNEGNFVHDVSIRLVSVENDVESYVSTATGDGKVVFSSLADGYYKAYTTIPTYGFTQTMGSITFYVRNGKMIRNSSEVTSVTIVNSKSSSVNAYVADNKDSSAEEQAYQAWITSSEGQEQETTGNAIFYVKDNHGGFVKSASIRLVRLAEDGTETAVSTQAGDGKVIFTDLEAGKYKAYPTVPEEYICHMRSFSFSVYRGSMFRDNVECESVSIINSKESGVTATLQENKQSTAEEAAYQQWLTALEQSGGSGGTQGPGTGSGGSGTGSGSGSTGTPGGSGSGTGGTGGTTQPGSSGSTGSGSAGGSGSSQTGSTGSAGSSQKPSGNTGTTPQKQNGGTNSSTNKNTGTNNGSTSNKTQTGNSSTAKSKNTGKSANTSQNIQKTISMKAGYVAKIKISKKVKTWKSSNKAVATVKSGKVTALKKGTAIIKATLSSGKQIAYKIKVTSSPTLKIGKKKVNAHTTYKIKRNRILTVNVSGKAAAVKNIYKSSNRKIAKVTSKATAKKIKIRTYKKKGKATVTIKVNGVSYKLHIKVV